MAGARTSTRIGHFAGLVLGVDLGLLLGLVLGGAACKDDALPQLARVTIDPHEGPNDAPTRIQLRGDFVFSRVEVDLNEPSQSRIERSMTATLGRFPISNLRSVSVGVASGLVHGENMPPGDYDLVVIDGELRRITLAKAFRVNDVNMMDPVPKDVGMVLEPDGGPNQDSDATLSDARTEPDAGAHDAENAPDVRPIDQCPASCGDGMPGPDKECDDGNLDDGDGCNHCCRIEPGYLCMRWPSVCFLANHTTWVSQANRCPGSGTRADPFCRVTAGVQHVNENVVILPGRYREAVEVRTQRLLITEGNAEIFGLIPFALRIRGGARARAVGLRFTGDQDVVVVAEPRSFAVLEECVLGPSLGSGLVVQAGGFATVDRTLIKGNPGGGVVFGGRQYRLTNDVIVQNGFELSRYGGVALLTTSTASIFANNTVAANQAIDTPGSVYCAVSSTRIVNSIIWSIGNGISGFNSGCSPRYSDLRVIVGGAGNFSSDPMFTDDLYHIPLTSPCVNAGDPAGVMPRGPAPPRDFGGKRRPRGPRVDVGAHEAR